MLQVTGVLLGDHHVLPFSEVIDWPRASVTLWSHDLESITDRLGRFSKAAVREMREQVSIMDCVFYFLFFTLNLVHLVEIASCRNFIYMYSHTYIYIGAVPLSEVFLFHGNHRLDDPGHH